MDAMDPPIAELDPFASRRRRVAPYAAAAVGVLLVALVGVLATRSPASDRDAESPLVGRAAPPLKGTTLDGATYDIDAQRGRFVLVNFFASWCQPCIIEHPELRRLAEGQEKRDDLSIVSVAFQDNDESIRRFFDRNGGDWPVLSSNQDPSKGSSVLEYGVFKLPETYLISPSGQVIYKFIGGVTADQVEAVIADAKQRGL